MQGEGLTNEVASALAGARASSRRSQRSKCVTNQDTAKENQGIAQQRICRDTIDDRAEVRVVVVIIHHRPNR